jgi:hypothetical protein
MVQFANVGRVRGYYGKGWDGVVDVEESWRIVRGLSGEAGVVKTPGLYPSILLSS